MFFLSITEGTSSVKSAVGARVSNPRRLMLAVAIFVMIFGSAKDDVAAESHVSGSSLNQRQGASASSPTLESYGKVPLSFEPNRGQTDARVQFLSRGPGYGIFLTPGEAVLSFQGKDKAAGQSVLQMKLVGANASAAAEAEEKLPGTANYMKGTDRSKWATGVPTYGKVKYAGVYPGVDLVFYGNQRQLEYDFVVAPGGDAGEIALEFGGAAPKVDAAGDLMFVDGGEARFKKPVVYQVVDGKRVTVSGDYEVRGQRVKFKLGKYDHSRELVIDPVLTYLTYLGGSTYNGISAIAVDSVGATYLTGYTSSGDFPLKGAYQSSIPAGATTMFVTKLNQSGTSLVYSTFLASNDFAAGSAIKVDSTGNVYVAGSSGDGFPVTSGAFQTICGGDHDSDGNRISGCKQEVRASSGVLAKLNADGSSLVYATYLGGSNNSGIGGVAVDQNGNAYVTGQTYSYCGAGPYSASTTEPFECFPTTSGAVQSGTVVPKPPQGEDTIQDSYAFLTKFDAAGSTLLYSSLLGPDPSGAASEVYGTGVAVNTQGVAFITGGTGFFPGTGGGLLYTTDGALQQTESPHGISAFLAAFDTNAGSLLYSTYLGGQNGPFDVGYGIAVDSAGNAYVTGQTYDCDFPVTAGAFETEAQYAPTDTANVGKCHTGFVAKLNPGGNALVWATYLGTAPLTPGTQAGLSALALGPDNSVYVAGTASGSGYPLKNPVLPQGNTNTVPVVTHLSADGSSALFSSTVGGPVSATESAAGIAVDSTGAIYLAGNTSEQYLPTSSGVVQPTFAGTPGTTQDGFVAKISPSTPPSPSNGLTGNLLANPGAELGSLADWTSGGNGTPQVDNGTYDSGINPHTGSYDFVGGYDSGTDSLSQTVSILQQGITAAQVDGGTLFANVSFWEQGLNQGDPSDDGSVTLTFLDGNSAAIGSAVTIGPEDSHDGTWANVTGIPAIPVGTRSITYTMNFIKNQLTDNDGFIDDNVLSIHTNTGLTIFPGTLHFGDVPVGSQSAAQTVSVTNQGATGITIEQVASELGANPADFVQTNNCPVDPAVLAAGASCQITVTFVPRGVGFKLAGVDLPDDTPPTDQFVRVDGTGTGGILQVNPGNLKTIAGTGVAGTTGNGGRATAAELNQPDGVAFDPSGNLYIADGPANVVRKVDTAGNISTFAGVGTGGFTGDGGPATQAELLDPASVTSDKNGNIYIQDTLNFVIRKVTASTGIITTIAGTPQTPGHSGDGGPATAAKFNQNQGARFDSAGNLFVPTCRGASIRKIDTAGNISTVAGNFTEGYSGDGGPATSAQLQCPSGVAIDAAGNLYIADASNNVIRKVTAATGIISTIAGSTAGTPGATGDGGAATAALLNLPNDVAFDGAGNLYIADSANNRVRRIDTHGIITTAAGGLNNAGSAAVNTPLGLTTDTAGNVYFSDSGNSAVREIFPQGVQPFPATQVGSTSAAQSLTLSNIGNVDVTLGSDGAFSLSGDSSDFALTPGSCGNGMVLSANGGSCAVSITFAPTAAGQRTLTVTIVDNALNTPQSFSIGGTGVAAGVVTPTITWAAPASILYGTALSGTQLDAVATGTGGVTLAGMYVYTPAAGAVLGVGAHSLSVTFTPTTAGYGPATGNTSITVTQFIPVLTWPTPAAITTAMPLSATQLDAAASDINGATVPGTYDYTPEAGTLLTAGTHQITVTFTPNDTVDFTSVSTTRSIVVTQANGGTAAATSTTLAVTSGGGGVTTVASGAVVTLTATVTAGGNSVSPGQVAFCYAAVASCTGTHLLAMAQLVAGDSTSTATYKFVPGLGVHSYRAVFLGTTSYAASASVPAALAVTGTIRTTTTIAQSGTAPNLTLQATSVGAGPYPVQNATQSVTINLGQSAQNYVLTGTGGSAGNGGTYGNYYNTQGSCVTAGTTTTCDLTGPFTSSTPGYAAGTYDFQTVFTGSITSAVTSQTQYPVGTNEPNDFQYSSFAPSTTMTLKLNVTGGGAYTIPLVANGNFDPNLDDINFADTAPVCGGTSLGSDPCQQDYVGTVPGATYTSPVTGLVEFEMASSPTLVGPTGTVSFLDTTNANAVLATGALGTATTALGSGSALINAASAAAGVATPGDLNGDGKLDVVFTNRAAGTLTVLLGKGDGTFTAAASPTTGAAPSAAVLADFNNDGILDIAVTNENDDTVTVLLGKGDGTFTAVVTAPTGSAPDALVVGDFNGDGNVDLIVTNRNDDKVTVLLGNGDGTFNPSEPIETVSTPGAIVAGDFNGDSKLDIAIAVGNQMNVYLGRGDGSFALSTNTATSVISPNSLAVADVNKDGKLDLVVADDAGYPDSDSDGGVFVLLGNGDGTFTAAASPVVGKNPAGVVATDLNGDGIVDLAVVNLADSTSSILVGKGDGTFTAQPTLTTANAPTAITAGDFNGDGYPDLVVATEGAETVSGPAVSLLLTQLTETAIATATGVAPAAGTHEVVASYPGDANFVKSVSQPTAVVVGGGTTTSVITWAPAVATIPYGTALGASQLNAAAATAAGVAIPGTFVYTPAAGAVLAAGTQTLSVAFTPTSTAFTAATATATITVTKAMPVITWAAPAGIAYGTALSATQLDATVAGVGAGALAGTLVYTPAAGTVLLPGTQTLNVAFTPTDAVDYTGATASVKIVVGGLGLSGIAPLGAVLGSANTTITLTGTGFVPTSVVLAGTNRLATTYVNPTTLTAVVPATLLGTTGTLAITVSDPSIASVSGAQMFTVLPVLPAATLTGPATTAPGTQPTVGLTITNPYPLALTAQFSLAFASAGSTPVDDPSIQFSTGGRMYSFAVAANSTSVPPVELQAGTDAGTITITATLMADGVDVTPAGLAPLVIVVPPAVPVLSGTTITASGNMLTVVVHGFSNTREVSQAVFDFTAATGDTLATPSLTIPATTIFGTWYTDPTSDAYGSTFTYTQIFNTSGDASTVGTVKVTLTNSVGVSAASTSAGP